jgi:hypothetical protein
MSKVVVFACFGSQRVTAPHEIIGEIEITNSKKRNKQVLLVEGLVLFAQQLELEAAGDTVGELFDVFVFHLLRVSDQRGDQGPHFGDILVAAAATFAVGSFFGAFTGAWTENHDRFPIRIRKILRLSGGPYKRPGSTVGTASRSG